MSLLPVRFRIENFLDIKDITLSFPGPGLYFVVGSYLDPVLGEISNGAGKTTCLNAVRYAIDGTLPTSPKTKTKVADIIGPHGKKVRTSVELLDTEGNRWSLVRERGRRGAPVVHLEKNEESEDSIRSATMTHERAGELLGIPWELLAHTHHIPQVAQKSGFLYDDDAKRKELVARLFRCEWMDEFLAIAKKDREKLAPVASAAASKVAGIEARYTTIQERITAVQVEAQRLQGEAAAATEANRLVEQASAQATTARQACVKELQEAEASLNAAQANVATKRAGPVAEAIRTRSWDIERLKADLKREEEKSAEHQAFIIQGGDAAAKEICRECGQPLATTEAIHRAKHRQQRAVELLSETTARARDLDTRIKAEASILEAHQRQQQVLEKEAIVLEARLPELQQKVTTLRNQLAELPPPPKLQPLPDTSVITRLLAEAQEALQEAAADLMEAQDAADTTTAQIARLALLIDALRYELRSHVFEGVTGILSQEINAELRRLCGDLLQVQIQAFVPKEEGADEKFAYLIKHRDKEDWRPGTTGSGAQQAWLNLANLLALRARTNIPLDLLLLDEPFEGCDARVAAQLMPVIREIAQNSVVLFVTHSRTNIPTDGKVIVIKYENGTISLAKGV